MADSLHHVPRYPKSLWRDIQGLPEFPVLTEDFEADVTIVGAGTTGLTAAYLLSKQGVKVALIEAGRILDGTTGYTTAKISSQHGAIYDDLITNFGLEKARLYYEANEEALAFIRKTAEDLDIDCDLTTEDAYAYTTENKNVSTFEKELKAYQDIGINGGEALNEIELPYSVEAALVIRNQAQFHPVKFFAGLIPSIEENGGRIFEQTRAAKVKGSKNPSIETTDGHTINSRHVIVSSHFPFNDEEGLYFSRLHAERSYTLAVTTEKKPPKGMYLSVDSPGKSLRYAKSADGSDLMILGGEGHTAGKNKENTFNNYERLREYGEKHFGITSIPYRWSAQDLITLDKVPYIGPAVTGKPNVFVATGYAKWGMSNGVAAALLLSDLVQGKDNRFADLFDPRRTKIKKADALSFFKENMDVGKELVAGKLHRKDRKLEELENDEGALVTQKGKKIGAYKDEDGRTHMVSTTCTHMGCDVEWNNAERSWDCPCHGSRFSYDGSILEGPAVTPLKNLDNN